MGCIVHILHCSAIAGSILIDRIERKQLLQAWAIVRTPQVALLSLIRSQLVLQGNPEHCRPGVHREHLRMFCYCWYARERVVEESPSTIAIGCVMNVLEALLLLIKSQAVL